MIWYFCELHPDKVVNLPSELLQQLLMSVELGLFSFGPEVATHCCDIIQLLVKHVHSEIQKGQPRNQLMAPFINVMLSLFFLTYTYNRSRDFFLYI